MNLILLVVSVLILTTASVSTNETKLKGNSVLYKVGIFVLHFKKCHLYQQAKDTLMKLM